MIGGLISSLQTEAYIRLGMCPVDMGLSMYADARDKKGNAQTPKRTPAAGVAETKQKNHTSGLMMGWLYNSAREPTRSYFVD